MEYDLETKTARLEATRARLDGCTLEIGTEGFAEILARFPLTASEVVDVELVFGGMPKRAMATNKGEAKVARVCDAAGAVRAQGFTVGDEASDADVIIYPDAQVKQGQTIEMMGFRIIHG